MRTLAKYSAGRILLMRLLEWCFINNSKSFDFTIGGENYKKDWCDKETLFYRTIRVTHPLGHVFLMMLRIKQRVKESRFLPLIKKLLRP